MLIMSASSRWRQGKGAALKLSNSPNMGDHVWLITSRHTEPLLQSKGGNNGDEPWYSGAIPDEDHAQFVDIRVKDLVHESDARALERVLVWQFHVYLPHSSCEGCYNRVRPQQSVNHRREVGSSSTHSPPGP